MKTNRFEFEKIWASYSALVEIQLAFLDWDL